MNIAELLNTPNAQATAANLEQARTLLTQEQTALAALEANRDTVLLTGDDTEIDDHDTQAAPKRCQIERLQAADFGV